MHHALSSLFASPSGRLRLLAIVEIALCIGGGAAAQAQVGLTGPAGAKQVAAAAAVYRVARNDELNFRFFSTPELNTVATVRSDGRVTLPLVGELAAAGLTLPELAAQVESSLAARVRRPQVSINVQGLGTARRVFIGGEVGRPGLQPLVGALTVAQAVIAAEGLKDSAQPREVTVLRSDGNGARVALKVDLAALMAGAGGATDIALAPDDVVIVPRSGIADVGLWVDQYVRRLIPINLGFSYSINRDGVVR